MATENREIIDSVEKFEQEIARVREAPKNTTAVSLFLCLFSVWYRF